MAVDHRPRDFDHLVLDAEPLVAYYLDEPGADVVEPFLLAIEDGELGGSISAVTAVEVYYACLRAVDGTDRDVSTDAAAEQRVADYLDTLRMNDVEIVPVDGIDVTTGVIKANHSIAIGDAFALGTAYDSHADHDGSVALLVGADDDYDPFVADHAATDGIDLTVFRFRDHAP